MPLCVGLTSCLTKVAGLVTTCSGCQVVIGLGALAKVLSPSFRTWLTALLLSQSSRHGSDD